MDLPREVLIDEGAAQVYVVRGWAPPNFVNFELANALVTGLPFTRAEFKMFGRPVKEAHPVVAIGQAGRTIHYAGIARPHIDWDRPLAEGGCADVAGVAMIRQMIPFLEQHSRHPLNSCLINSYPTGKDYLGFHRDAKTAREWNEVVTVSVGGSRKFEFQRMTDKNVAIPVMLHNGDLMLMTRHVHELWRHGVPTMPGAQPRASLTFRYVETQ